MASMRRFGMGRVRRFIADQSGIAAVETALLLPVALLVLGLAIFGGEGLGIQRKTTLAARTIADLVGQTSTTGTVNNTSTATIPQTTLDYYLSLASLIVYPYDTSVLKAEVSEVQIISGTSTGKVCWSEGYNGGVARTQNQIITLSPSVIAAGETNLILAETQYTYSPVGVGEVMGPLTITGSIFMIPRSVSSITVNWTNGSSSPC
jgi:Flp pilus assembly protein TadG